MTEITWTNCADEMPPDDRTRVIIKIYDGYIVDHASWFTKYRRTLVADLARWAPYTPEKWRELNDIKER